MRLACLPFIAVAMCGCAGNQNIIEAAKSGNLARVKQIVDSDPSQMYLTDNNGNSPAIWAILEGHKDVAICLVEKGYPMDGCPQSPFPLLLACCSRYDKSSDEMLEYLLKRGADPNIVYKKEDWTALGMAVNNYMPVKVRLLVQFGARMDQVDNTGKTPLELARDRLAQMKDPNLHYPHGEPEDPAARQKLIDRWSAMVSLLESLQKKP